MNLMSNFHDNVALKYSLYNSLFLTLPFQKMQEAGALLTLFGKYAAREIKLGKHPQTIVDNFFKKNLNHIPSADKMNMLFIMLQFVERQIVLFDALEDAAYSNTHRLDGPGTLANLLNKVITSPSKVNLGKSLQDYTIRVVLTAHPTQFYPYPVLAIITQLTNALQQNNLKEISELLWQMGKTSFKHQQKPTPLQEAHSLIWYVENIFYPVIPQIEQNLQLALKQFHYYEPLSQPTIELGFWPGGDRDGNPYVDAETTIEVAQLLKNHLIKSYQQDLKTLSKKLTFKGVLENLLIIRQKLESDAYNNAEQLLADLNQLRHQLINDHNSLFLEHLELMITKVRSFGFHLAAMDMRDNSPVHHHVLRLLLADFGKEKDYLQCDTDEKIALLKKLFFQKRRFQLTDQHTDPQFVRTIQSIAAIRSIQLKNGEKSLCRYIISNTHSALNVLELLTLLRLAGKFEDNIPMDIVPLFESIDDLENSSTVMEELYQCDWYRQHLANRGNIQTIMMGFSDGTKDGGYVAANWAIHKAKMNLTELTTRHHLKVIFFDGRGGPPARGGGNTHNFYRSLGSRISHHDLQLTIQGQTVSSNFGTEVSARYNLEQLFTAGLDDLLFPDNVNDLSPDHIALIQQLADHSQKVYISLKEDPLFIPYLEEMTPLKFYSELNIGSRPGTRKKSAHLQFSDLRAIPFVGAWSQLKQNIPGYFGFGSALQKLIEQGKLVHLKNLYHESLFFRTLVENTMMSLCKTFFPLTSYMRKDQKFGKFWQKLHSEAKLTQTLLEQISGQSGLLANDPLNRESIKLREEIVLPLLIIQQYAMSSLRELADSDPTLTAAYKQMILKALAANTNASRNAA